MIALALVACSSAPEIDGPKTGNGGASGGVPGGSIGGSIGGMGGGFPINTNLPRPTGGNTSPVCNSTSTSGCRTETPAGCGDGVNNQPSEECDDGNALPGDGCNGVCKREPNWSCPKEGRCTRSVVCGDGVLGPGEVCDDRNTVDGDGCNATCTVQDPSYRCVAGQPCVRISQCGNKRVDPGEDCDDGNTLGGDGCGSTCQLEDGWVCPTPGQSCKRAPRCGDGVVQPSLGELCDDGNRADGDGCSADCKTKGTGCVCVPGQLCSCPTVKCGDGNLEGSEQCDDGNAEGGDGCSGDCKTVEPGYQCRMAGKPCVPRCGDGVLAGIEACDDGNTASGDGCSATCRLEPGFKCDGSPSKCSRTTCGDRKKEGAEGCDDGNTMPFDACSQDCQAEPDCSGASCTSKCGDGIMLMEACDDGNAASGDGCSSDCKVEAGWTCTQPPLEDKMSVPVIYRDFKFGNPSDFEPNVTGAPGAVVGMVASDLDQDGKPVYTGLTGQGITVESKTTFSEWYRTTANVNHPTAGKLALWKTNQGSYVNRYGANGEQWKNGVDGNPLFFPVDGDTFTPASELAGAQVPEFYDLGLPYDVDQNGNERKHNFSFTSEVRYWFKYDSQSNYKLDFVGDDDVWVFINKKLAVDLGGLHSPASGSVTLDGATAAKLGNLKTGNVYEVAVFQAERHTTASSYKLTLTGFSAAPSSCVPTCGDGIVAGNEFCDCGNGSVPVPASCPGANDKPSYGGCTAQCTWGGFCGDGITNGPEQCDNGTNHDGYGVGSGCAPGCKLPPRCGDGVVQNDFDEECDDGAKNATSTDRGTAYGQCMASCRRGGYCGDAVVQGPERCDDGVNDGTYGTCTPDCLPAPGCGDGVVQADYGEECEPTMSNDPNCSPGCKKPGGCGDGIVQLPEQCDYGAQYNTGEYGGCAPGCVYAPHCGDGVVNGPEDCDDGVNDGSYGGCTGQCKLGPHCGDGVVNGPEECDDGADNGSGGVCSGQCKKFFFPPP